MLYILYSLNALLMIAMPVALGYFIAKKTEAKWRLFGIGAITLIGSQVVHIPLNFGLTALFHSFWPSAQPQPWHIPFNSVVLGLTAGLCEELARYAGYRWLAPKARSFRDGLMLGAGHGGTEAIILGFLTGLSFISLAGARGVDLTTQGLAGEALKQAQAQIAAYWSAPWYMALLGAVERALALVIQVSLSLMVLQVFVRRSWRWLGLAIGYHALTDAVAAYGVQSHWPVLTIEGMVGVFALGGLAFMWALWPRREGLIPPEPELVLVPGASMVERKDDREERLRHERVEESRYG